MFTSLLVLRGRLLGAGPTPEEERAAMEKNRDFCPIEFGSPGRAHFARTKRANTEKQKSLFFLSGRIEVARASRLGDPSFVRANLNVSTPKLRTLFSVRANWGRPGESPGQPRICPGETDAESRNPKAGVSFSGPI